MAKKIFLFFVLGCFFSGSFLFADDDDVLRAELKSYEQVDSSSLLGGITFTIEVSNYSDDTVLISELRLTYVGTDSRRHRLSFTPRQIEGDRRLYDHSSTELTVTVDNEQFLKAIAPIKGNKRVLDDAKLYSKLTIEVDAE